MVDGGDAPIAGGWMFFSLREVADVPGGPWRGMVAARHHQQSSSQAPPLCPGYADPSPGGHDPPARGGAAGWRAGAWGQAEGAGPAPNGPPQQMAPVAGARHPVWRE